MATSKKSNGKKSMSVNTVMAISNELNNIGTKPLTDKFTNNKKGDVVVISRNIYECTDYGKFETLSTNRLGSMNDASDANPKLVAQFEKRVKQLMREIGKNGYDLNSPVLVVKIMFFGMVRYILSDGQGRIEACRRLGVPYYYIIDEISFIDKSMTELNDYILRINNTQTVWAQEDKINCFLKGNSGNPEIAAKFARLNDVSKKLNISIRQAFEVLYTNTPPANLVRNIDKMVNLKERSFSNEVIEVIQHFVDKKVPFASAMRFTRGVLKVIGNLDETNRVKAVETMKKSYKSIIDCKSGLAVAQQFAEQINKECKNYVFIK